MERFAARLRDQVDLDALHGELLTVVDQTMRPTLRWLWLHPTGGPRVAVGRHQPHTIRRQRPVNEALGCVGCGYLLVVSGGGCLPGQTYCRRKLAEGKSPKEALRCLKRRLSDAVYRCLVIDQQGKGGGGSTSLTLPIPAGDQAPTIHSTTQASTSRWQDFCQPARFMAPLWFPVL